MYRKFIVVMFLVGQLGRDIICWEDSKQWESQSLLVLMRLLWEYFPLVHLLVQTVKTVDKSFAS